MLRLDTLMKVSEVIYYMTDSEIDAIPPQYSQELLKFSKEVLDKAPLRQ